MDELIDLCLVRLSLLLDYFGFIPVIIKLFGNSTEKNEFIPGLLLAQID